MVCRRGGLAALPGGKIIVFSGLLADAGSPDELAGVLAHEIQHVLHRDALRGLVGRLGGSAVIAVLLGGGDLARIVELRRLAGVIPLARARGLAWEPVRAAAASPRPC